MSSGLPHMLYTREKSASSVRIRSVRCVMMFSFVPSAAPRRQSQHPRRLPFCAKGGWGGWGGGGGSGAACRPSPRSGRRGPCRRRSGCRASPWSCAQSPRSSGRSAPCPQSAGTPPAAAAAAAAPAAAAPPPGVRPSEGAAPRAHQLPTDRRAPSHATRSRRHVALLVLPRGRPTGASRQPLWAGVGSGRRCWKVRLTAPLLDTLLS